MTAPNPQAGPLTGLGVGADGAGLPHPAPRQPHMFDQGRSAATISADGLHRYNLWRGLTDDPRQLVYVMCNPSTADAFADDPTITKCKKIAAVQGYGQLVVVNLWSYRTSEPRLLIAAANNGIEITGGVTNWAWMRFHMERASKVIVAWGAIAANVPGYEDRVRALRLDAAALDLDLFCLGVTKDGYPKHPMARGKSRIPDDQPLVRWHAS